MIADFKGDDGKVAKLFAKHLKVQLTRIKEPFTQFLFMKSIKIIFFTVKRSSESFKEDSRSHRSWHTQSHSSLARRW